MGFFEDFKKVIRIYPDVKGVARRMFVTNSLDGIVAGIGVDIGGFSHNADPLLLASSIIGGTVAMGVISGILGVYLSERAERIKEVKDLERKVASSLKDSIYWKAVKILPIYVALWSGIGIVLFPFLIALPYLLSAWGILPLYTAYLSSIGIGLGLMGVLGYYLGRISNENISIAVARVLAMGVAAIIIVKLLRLTLGV